MRIGSGDNTYEWTGNWAKIPNTESARTGWAHHGVVVTDAGNIIAYHQGDPTVLVFDSEGNLRSSWDSGLTEAHGITLVKEGGTEYLWMADNGRKRAANLGYGYPEGSTPVSGRAVKTTLDGRNLMSLKGPELSIYREGDYMPTSVAVNEERHGGNGDVWVADGYGQSYVHRYDKAGNYMSSINGEEGEAGAFNCPHGIFVDRRRGEPELYVADRTNRRVQVYDLDGVFKRSFGSEFLSSPSGFVTDGDLLIVAELRARLAVLDGEDSLVCYLGDNEEVATIDGWPNVPSEHIEPGKFNSPHGIAVDGEGNLFVAEWLIGGRITKLGKS